MKTERKYEMRVTAYIDILGFSDIISNTIDKNGTDVVEQISLIHDAYEAVRDVWNLDLSSSERKEITVSDTKIVTTFSDSIVISFKITEQSEVFHTILELQWMIMRLIVKGILCRGAVTYGKLYHTEQMLFGPALVEAYLLESKAALYPRVILDKSLIDLGSKSGRHNPEDEAGYIKDMLERDTDGMYYIDYFIKAQSELNDPQYDFPEYIDKLADLIRKGLMGASSPTKVDVRIKYYWMKERYNILVEKCKNRDFIKRLKQDREYYLAAFYINLKKINPSH